MKLLVGMVLALFIAGMGVQVGGFWGGVIGAIIGVIVCKAAADD